MYRSPIIALILLTAACGSSDSSSASHEDGKSDRSPEGNGTVKELTYIDLNEDKIRQKLKDPESAKFRNSRVFYAVAPIVCGEVNAANSFGGKNGFQRFVSGGTVQALEEEMAEGEMDKLWAQVCT